jgi:hypothetical protein
MIYCDLGSLALAAANTDQSDKLQLQALGRLVAIYFDALDNPPDGVIGVGAISYAEAMLIDHQLELVDA